MMSRTITFFTTHVSPALPLATFLGLLIVSRSHSYLLFHMAVEMFIIIIAVCVFLFSWNTRTISRNNYFLFLGIACASVAAIDFFHMITYRGMNVLGILGANTATQLWLSQRYVLSVSALIAPFFIKRHLNVWIALLVYAFITVSIVLSIFYFKNFPLSYVEGSGLTSFKIYSEYCISLLFISATYVLVFMGDVFDKKVFTYLTASLLLNALSELMFTLYLQVTDVYNMVGHILVLCAFYLLYKAIIEVGLTKPYNLLFLELRRMSERKDEFIHILSHEIKNPLTAIKLNADVALQRLSGNNSADVGREILHIRSGVNTITSLMNDLLDLGNIEAGKISLKNAPMDFDQFIREIVETSQRISPDHTLIIKGETHARITCDKERLTQVFVNLLTNARKYSPKGSTILVNSEKRAGFVQVDIRDFGIGIPKEDQPYIFDKYFRTQKGEERAQGLGLGLYIAKEIIIRSGGKIWAESDGENGSTFFVTLPCTI